MVTHANPRVLKRDVERAAADYQKAMELYGAANLETSRRLGKWQELQAAYEKQTGKPMYTMNPSVRKIDLYVNDYDSALKFLRGRSERKLANNTKVWDAGTGKGLGTIRVRLHNTDIVIYHPDGTVELNSGRYHTVTTKQRINQLLPPGFYLEQKDYNWYLRAPDGSKEDFFDGIKVQGPLPEAAKAQLQNLSRQMTPPKYPGHQPNPPHDKEGLVGYIDVPREGEELRDWQGKLMGWRILANLRTYRNVEGEKSYGVILINTHRSSRTRYAGGLLLVDGGSLFRGRKFPGVKADEAHDEARNEAEYWAQIDAEDVDREPPDEDE